MVQQILKITEDTVLKRRPEQALELEPADLSPVKAGTTFNIQSYAYADAEGSFKGHIKFALAEGTVNGFNTWFVYSRHAQVESDGEVVYPLEEQEATQVLEVVQDTLLKRRPVQSTELSEAEKSPITKGTQIELHSYAYADSQGDFDNHTRFAIRHKADYINGLSTWYAYTGHIQVKFDGKVIYPLPKVLATPKSQPSAVFTPIGNGFKLPGNSSTFYVNTPILPGGSFTWGEATHGGERIPRTAQEVDSMIALAKQLQRAREQLGKPMHITSWYRPEPFNRRAGGARYSQHLTGKAVDFWVEGHSGRSLANLLRSWWPGGMGIYAHLPGIIHLDVGSSRKWGF